MNIKSIDNSINMIFLPVILFLIVNQPTNAKTNCDDSCSTKTYSLSSKLEPSCTKDCPFEAKISVIEKDHFDEYLNLTLIGYNVPESEPLTIATEFKKGPTSTDYICDKFISGLTRALVTRNSKSKAQTIGSSIYMNGNLYCTWIMQKKNTVLWPLGENEPANLFEDPNYQISLSVNKSSVIVASNSTQLPIYMRQYTKCCGYKVRGNKKYSLIARQNKDSTDFLLQVLGQTPKVAKVAFSKSDGVIITTECIFDADIIGVNGLITLNGQSSPLTEPLTNGKVFDNRCSWTLPGVVKYNSGKLDTKKGSFNLKIFVDETPVYNEDNVNLSGFAFTTSASFIVIMMSVMINFIFL